MTMSTTINHVLLIIQVVIAVVLIVGSVRRMINSIFRYRRTNTDDPDAGWHDALDILAFLGQIALGAWQIYTVAHNGLGHHFDDQDMSMSIISICIAMMAFIAWDKHDDRQRKYTSS